VRDDEGCTGGLRSEEEDGKEKESNRNYLL
jgi:hypothetical protein